MEGIGGGGTFQIVGAQEEGNQLVMEYQLYDADNIPIAFGTLVAEKEGDSWKYHSMTGEEYIASAFEYPAPMERPVRMESIELVQEKESAQR